MSGSNMELDGCGQQGFGERPVSTSGGLGSAGLPTASTDSLTADTSEDVHSSRRVPVQVAALDSYPVAFLNQPSSP